MRYLDVFLEAQALYEAFEDWITTQISIPDIFSHQELFDWMVLDSKMGKVDKRKIQF